jgi:DNA-binding SARP family transcriptional activator
MPEAMEFGLLGPLMVRSGETEVPVPRGHQRALLAILLLEANRPVPVEAIAEALWGPAPPRSAPVAIRSYIRWLRLALGQVGRARISTQSRGYQIRVDDGELDLARFERLLASAQAAVRNGSWQEAAGQAREALSCWRGEPLADIESDALALREAPRLAELRLQAAEIRVDADLRLGGQAEVIAELQHLCAAHPLREHLYALLMLALYRCGRKAEALAAYQRLRAVLVEELGADPGAELQTLHHQILTADPVLAVREPAAVAMPGARPGAAGRAGPGVASGMMPTVPRQLPTTVAYFTGRAAELAVLAQMLDQAGGDPPGAVVISAIGGMAGVGKTALAVRWAHQVAPRFGDGQLYVNLRGFDHTDAPAAPAEAVRGFLDALGVTPERIPIGPDAQAGLFRSLLADRKVLIVLDNARDEQQVRPLLPAGPGCLVLITSRRQLVGLAAADGARLLTLDLLSHAEARQVLTLRLGADRATAEPDAVDQIAGLCAGLPLALAVAAARAHARPRFLLATLAAELNDMASRLDALDAGDPAASVRAVFSWSYQQLSPESAGMFRLLGLHPGPDVTVPAAASLTATGLSAAGQALRELTAANLLTEHPPGRYACHDLLRAYAAELAHAVDDEQARDAATDRMLDHYLHTAHAAALLLKPSREAVALAPPRPGVTPERLTGYQQAMAWFEAEHQVLIGAARAAQAGYGACAWKLPSVIADFLDRRGHWRESAAIQRTALAAARSLGDTAAQAMVGRDLGRACAWLTDYDQARTHMTESLALYRKLGDVGGQARAHQSLAWLAGREGRVRDSIQHAELALDMFRAAGNRAGQAAALNGLGYSHVLLGEAQRAGPFCRQALALNQELQDRRGEAHAWDSLGYAEHHLGHYRDAADCYQSALSLFRELGDRFNEAEILTHLGDTQHAAENTRGAQDAWRQALDIFDDLHHPDADQIRAKLGAYEDAG